MADSRADPSFHSPNDPTRRASGSTGAEISVIAVFTPPKSRGDAGKAIAAAAVRHDGEYYVPIEHHNPMELYAATVIVEKDGKFAVYDKTQGVQNVHGYLCGVFGMKPEDVRVMSPFMGGGFGSGCVRSSRWCWPCWQRERCSAPSAWC